VDKRLRTKQFELIPLQTVRCRTYITFRSHRLHRRLLCDARLQRKLVKTVWFNRWTNRMDAWSWADRRTAHARLQPDRLSDSLWLFQSHAVVTREISSVDKPLRQRAPRVVIISYTTLLRPETYSLPLRRLIVRAVLIGRITCFARPFVCPSRIARAPGSKTKRRTKINTNVERFAV